MGIKKKLIVSVNPDSACILAEFNIIKNISGVDKVYSINLNKILNHIHPDENKRDYILEALEFKFKRFISKYTHEIKIKKYDVFDAVIPSLPAEISQIRLYKINEVNIGLSALSTAASFSKCTSSKTVDYGNYIKDAWNIAHRSYYLGIYLMKFKFDEIYIFNGRHAISRPIAEVFKYICKIKVNYYEFNYSREKFTLSDRGFHDLDYMVEMINKNTIAKKNNKNYFEEIKEGRINSDYKKIQDSFSKYTKIKHDSSIRWITFFTSSADEFFANKDSDVINSYFNNQFEIALYLSSIQKKYNFRLIIRMHPNLQYKHPSWENEWEFNKLTDNNASLFYPNDALSSYKLLKISSCIVTVGSSIGLESIERGIPCLEIGQTIGIKMNITVCGNNLNHIEEFIENPWMNIKSKEAIDKYNSYQVDPPFDIIFNKKGVEMSVKEIENTVSPIRSKIKEVKKIIIDSKISSIILNHMMRVKCKKIISKIDSEMPLKGSISENGYIFIGPEGLSENFASFSEFQPNVSISIHEHHLNDFIKLFDLIIPEAVAYLGDGIIIDSITVTKIDSNSYDSVSANWHTDNVGHNLKVYVCIEGDGSIVTKYIPKSNKSKYKVNFIEDLRMIGLKNRKTNSGEIEIKHEKGSLAIFDTNGLHRGGYTRNQKNKRIVLEIEISDKIKSRELTGYAPIGLRSGNNTFFMDKNFYNHFKYKKYFDIDRIKNHNKNILIYGATPTNYELN
jgi:hypothetical protein